MSAKGWIPKFISTVEPKTSTPVNATLLTSGIILFLTLFIPLVTLAKSTSFLIFIVFTLVNIALIKIKLKDPSPSGVKIYPLWIPMVAITLNIIMLLIQIVSIF
jgi:amino acid transporter